MRRALLSLVLLAGCAYDDNPWARRPTAEERLHWGDLCGEGRGNEWSRDWNSPPGADVFAECGYGWSTRHDRFTVIEIRTGFHGGRPTAAQIAPYRQLIERELPDDLLQLFREVGDGEERTVHKDDFQFWAGYDDNGWNAMVQLPSDH